MIVASALFILLCIAGTVMMVRTHRFNRDLLIAEAVQCESAPGSESRKTSQRLELQKNRALFWLAGAAVGLSLQLLLSGKSGGINPAPLLSGALIAEFFWQRRQRAAKRKYVRQLEFYLPTVMERVVMAVGAGFDILPALTEAARDAHDPVSRLLQKVTTYMNAGLGLEDSLKAAMGAVECPVIKHACVHLALAYRQGGELVRPLRELGDSTQAYYQESVEEEIAKLPVKAVMPLVLTFAGLLLCFLTVPIIQLGSLSSKVAYESE
jgi:Flp pilus assembly protein TadB